MPATADLVTPQTARAPAIPSRAVHAALRKELRGNISIASALLGIVAVITVIAIFFQWQFNDGYNDLSTVANILLLPATQIAANIAVLFVAFVLGFAQLRNQTSIDAWAFLIHRPTSRLTLFIARVLAGLILYVFAVGIPIAVLFTFAATRAAGVFFDWRFMLPILADAFTGVVYYFAGMLIAQRQSSLIGPRILPLFLAISCSYFTHSVDSFTSTCVIIAAYASLMLIAAAGSFHSRGFQLRVPRISHAAHILITLAGLTVLIAGPLAFGHAALNRNAEDQVEFYSVTASPYRPPQILITRIQLPDGTIGNRIRLPSDTILYTRLDYTPTSYTEAQVDPAEVGDTFTPITSPITPRFTARPVRPYRDLRGLFGQQEIYDDNPQLPQMSHEELWFFMYPENRFYIYREHPYAYLGTFGQNGFVPPGSKADSSTP